MCFILPSIDSNIDLLHYLVKIKNLDIHVQYTGVAIYIHNVVDYKITSDLSDPDLEFLYIQLHKPKAKPFLLSNWYRPPNTPVELFDKFEVLLGKIEAENIESNILGDINCYMIAISPANETRHLIELCESYQYA